MKIIVLTISVVLAGCAPVWKPDFRPIEEAPTLVQQGILIDRDEHGELIQKFEISVRRNPGRWLLIATSLHDDKMITRAVLDPGDDAPLIQEDFIIDTGSFGYLTIPKRRYFVDRLWLPAIGQDQTTTAVDRATVYHGAAEAFVLPGILVAPIPLSVISNAPLSVLQNRSILGLETLAIAHAVLIDPSGSRLLITFTEQESEAIRSYMPDSWIAVPWHKNANGMRTLSITIGGEKYDALLDTAAAFPITLRSKKKPRCAIGPIVRSTLWGFRGERSIYSAQLGYPIVIGRFPFDSAEIAWYDASNGSRKGDCPAILGLPFFQQWPAILDFENDRVLLFVGNRDQLDDYIRSVMTKADEAPPG